MIAKIIISLFLRTAIYLIIVIVLCDVNHKILCQNIIPTIVVHGGTGPTVESIPYVRVGVKEAARIGHETLLHTGNAVDAVQAAVQYFESDVNFSCGNGSILNWEGIVEMDAAIMIGIDLNAGCVAAVKNLLHPVSLARSVMDKSRHVLFAGAGAMAYAKDEGFEILPEGALITETNKKLLENYKKVLRDSFPQYSKMSLNELAGKFDTPPLDAYKLYFPVGTVGAVAIDANGNVAAAMSTGGLTAKMPGRVGDGPILGGGTYADNAAGCVVSTGNGETIMRYRVSSRILTLTEHFGLTAQEASEQVLNEMAKRFKKTAGVISIDFRGNVGIYFTTRRMPWAYQRGNELHYGVDRNEDIVEIVDKSGISD